MDPKDAYTKVFLQSAGLATDPDTVKKYRAVWWWNVRRKDTGGLRLTEQGLEFVEKYAIIKTYKVEFPNDFAFTPQVLVWLDNFIESPFFITKKHITVMREKSAFELYLFSGDVRKMGHNKAMAKRISQESSQS
jgi:hypothetical protein